MKTILEQSRADNITFRVLSAFGIICVVMGHFGCISLTFDNVFPYATFHIPLFFFVSGYFLTKKSVKNILELVLKKGRTLLLPFYIYYFFNLVIESLLGKYGFAIGDGFSFYNYFVSPWINLQPSGFMAPAWFIIAFFIMHVLNGFFQGFLTKTVKADFMQDVITTIVYFFAGLLVYMHRELMTTDFEVNIAKGVLGLTVFWIGYLYKTYFERFEIRVPSRVLIPAIVVVRCVSMYCFGWGSIAWYSLNGLGKPYILSYVYMVVVAILGILFWLRISRMFADTFINTRKSILVFLGRHTYAVMSWHLLALFIIQGIIGFLNVRYNMFPGFDFGAYKNNVYYVWYADTSNTMILSIVAILMVLQFIRIFEPLRAAIKKHITEKFC